MSIEKILRDRSGEKCELCASSPESIKLEIFAVVPSDGSADQTALLCSKCAGEIESSESLDENHWHCLQDSMWSEHLPVQILAWRLLSQLGKQELVEQIYLEDSALKWAKSGLPDLNMTPTRDSNGAALRHGDTVHLIKDLVVKGANFTAKRGTIVKNISLTDNPEHIEGKVNGVKIVLVSAYLKKA